MGLYRHFYRAFKERYAQLPAGYVQETLRVAAQVLKSWRELRKFDLVKKSRPLRVEKCSVVVHPQCWRFASFTSVEVAVRSDSRRCKYVRVEFDVHRHFLRYFNGEWELCK